LKPSQLRTLERLYHRRTPPGAIITPELGATLCKISREIGRQVGVLINRGGRVEYVIAGDQTEIVIPNLSRIRAASGRLKGLRLVHTHLKNEPLSKDDLTDLAMLRLDLVMALGVSDGGRPMSAYIAHLDPSRRADDPWVVLDPGPFSGLDFHFGEFVKSLENELSRQDVRRVEKDTLRAVLVHISELKRNEAERCLDELSELARTEKIVSVDKVIYRGSPNPQNLLGAGRMRDLVIRSLSMNVDMILFDQELTPAQARWTGQLTDMPILDRTQLILRIFARRAHTKDGKLRVELARLKYTLPRLGTRADALSRIRGGIGIRGPGETAMEVSRRRIKDRISHIRAQLEKLGHGREQRRSLRKRAGVPQVAVIGYTNAGKSTLLNAITKSSVLVEDKLFATLDPTSRRVRFPKDMEVVISDTVGFIRDLPEDLLDAFRSTLEELNDSDLLIHLVDVSDAEYEKSIETVEGVLSHLGLDRIPRMTALNKIDAVDAGIAANIAARYGAIAISASERIGLDKLVTSVVNELETILGAGRKKKSGEAFLKRA